MDTEKNKALTQVETQFESKLTEALTEFINSYDVPVSSDENRKLEKAITIFITRAKDSTSKRNVKNKYLKNHPQVKIAFSQENNFDITEVRNAPHGLVEIHQIFEILNAKCTQSSLNRITYWSKAIFTAVSKAYSEDFLILEMLPFEVQFDENDQLSISKLPKVKNLYFSAKKDSSKLIDLNDFFEEQADSLIESLNLVENFQKKIKETKEK